MGWPVFLLGPGLGLARAKAWGPVCSRAGVGRALEKIIFPKLPMYAGWCGGAKPPTPHFYQQMPGLLVTAFPNYRLGL